MKRFWFIGLLIIVSCGSNEAEDCNCEDNLESDTIAQLEEQIAFDRSSIVILGTTQDAGSPQINCQKECCRHLRNNPEVNRKVVSLGLIDSESGKKYLFEATPDFQDQLDELQSNQFHVDETLPDGIFLTHAHIGHYAGLMYLGKEAIDANEIPVYVMPAMRAFLENNGPWDLLIERKNILINEMTENQPVFLSDKISVVPFLVPHRDEYSETVGFRIEGPNKSAIFIPDIDKWDKWNKDIITVISTVDYAFIDATFFDENELKNRNMAEIPHPFVVESMELFKDLSAEEKAKVIFIHLNHTNPLLDNESEQFKQVIEKGFNVAQRGDVYYL